MGLGESWVASSQGFLQRRPMPLVFAEGGWMGIIFKLCVLSNYQSRKVGIISCHNLFQVQQLIDSVAGFGWSFIVTLLLLGAMNLFPGLRLRVTPEVERIGIDLGELGVNAYEFHEDLRTQLTSEREFRNVWHRTYGDILPVTNCYNAGGGGEGRKFDYAAQQENFCRRKQANSHS